MKPSDRMPPRTTEEPARVLSVKWKAPGTGAAGFELFSCMGEEATTQLAEALKEALSNAPEPNAEALKKLPRV